MGILSRRAGTAVLDEPTNHTIPAELRGVPTVDDIIKSPAVPDEDRGDIELSAEARIGRTRGQQIRDNRRQVNTTFARTISKRVAMIQEGLTAAAQVMDETAEVAPAPNAVTRTWQHAAYGYVNTVGELNAGRMYVGNALSRCSLAVGKRNPDGSVEQGFDGEEPVEGLDPGVADEAAELIAAIRSPRGGQSELLRSSGEKLFVTGELYYVPNDTPMGMMFEILSTQELLRDGLTWTKYLGPGYGAEPLPAGVNPIRVWRPDGQWSMLATSSVRSCLEILEELVVLTRLVRASAISRMALAGILTLPDELDNPDEEVGPDGQQSEAMNPLAVDMINTGAKAIDDPANAAAWMPYIIQGPMEYLEGIKHIAFEAANEQQTIERTEALQRLAQGLDLPVEVILGHMNTTFTNAQQISIDTFRIHLEPTLQLICDALTVAYLWPAMAKNRGINPDDIKAGAPYPDEVLSVAVTYDAHHLISRPDRIKEMVEVFTKDVTQSAVQISEIRDALNLDPEQVVDPAEQAMRVDAIRLGKIRETIAAPATDAASPLSDAGAAVVPGESAAAQMYSSGELHRSPLDQGMAIKTVAAIEITVSRAIERLGAKVRTKAKATEREQWTGIDNVALVYHLGPVECVQLLGDDLEQVVRTDVNALMGHVSRWMAEHAMADPEERKSAACGIYTAKVIGDSIRDGKPGAVSWSVIDEILNGS